MIMYAITHVGKDGLRTLTFNNWGSNHYKTAEEAQRGLDVFAPELRAKVLGDMADTLAVRPVDCYAHGDAKGIYFDD